MHVWGSGITTQRRRVKNTLQVAEGVSQVSSAAIFQTFGNEVCGLFVSILPDCFKMQVLIVKKNTATCLAPLRKVGRETQHYAALHSRGCKNGVSLANEVAYYSFEGVNEPSF